VTYFAYETIVRQWATKGHEDLFQGNFAINTTRLERFVTIHNKN